MAGLDLLKLILRVQHPFQNLMPIVDKTFIKAILELQRHGLIRTIILNIPKFVENRNTKLPFDNLFDLFDKDLHLILVHYSVNQVIYAEAEGVVVDHVLGCPVEIG